MIKSLLELLLIPTIFVLQLVLFKKVIYSPTVLLLGHSVNVSYIVHFDFVLAYLMVFIKKSA